MTDYTAAALDAARRRFYPGWWTHSPVERPVERLPRYRVVCADEEERQLALAAKPAYVAVDLVLARDDPYRAAHT